MKNIILVVYIAKNKFFLLQIINGYDIYTLISYNIVLISRQEKSLIIFVSPFRAHNEVSQLRELLKNGTILSPGTI